MAESRISLASDNSESEGLFVHTVQGAAGRLLLSDSRWNSIELDFNLLPQSAIDYDSLPSRFSKSIDFNLTITDTKYFKRFLYISALILVLVLALVLLVHFLPRKHHHQGTSEDLTHALGQALLFFDAQKSGHYPKNSLVKFRGDSGLHDGNTSNTNADLVGGFYDSGNNMKFSFTTAYTVTLLSWTVMEYHQKYADIGELDHVKDIIRWGSDYLLKLFIPPNTTSDPTILYAQVGGNDTAVDNDINCWQRPEDMIYPRPVSVCDSTASDLAGEIIAGMSAASLVFGEEKEYSEKLVKAAEKLFNLATDPDPSHKQGTYTTNDDCGGQARQFYNSSGYRDELVWGGTWLFLATGNDTYLKSATENLAAAEEEELLSEKDVFYWNNKMAAVTILLTRIRFFRDLGYPYEAAFRSSTNRTDLLMCSYASSPKFTKTKGGLIILKPESGRPLQYAATASFLSKLYSDYLELLHRSGGGCPAEDLPLSALQDFSKSQVKYILGDNPKKMSYIVGFGKHYPVQVHHRGASIPSDGQWRSCAEGERWLKSKEPNLHDLSGAMVAGPDKNDNFLDERGKAWFTEPSISANAGLVAALIALHDPPSHSSDSSGRTVGVDKMGMLRNIHLVPSHF